MGEALEVEARGGATPVVLDAVAGGHAVPVLQDHLQPECTDILVARQGYGGNGML